MKIFRVQKKVTAVSERPGSLARLQEEPSVESNEQARAASASVHTGPHTRDS